MFMTSFEEYSLQSTEEQRDQELYKMFDDIEQHCKDAEELHLEVERIDGITKSTGYWFEGISYSKKQPQAINV